MPSNEESESANGEQAAGKDATSASPDHQADSPEQVQEEVLHLRRVLLGLANEIIFALGADPDTASMPRFDRGPHSEGPPGPMMRRRLPREWDDRAGPPPRRGMPPPWVGYEGAMGGPPGGRRRRGPVDEGEEGR